MRIFALACIHNDIESLLALLERVPTEKFDVIVCPGDFTDLSVPKGFTRVDVGRLILEELKATGKPVIVVPGSWDKELIDFFDRQGVSVHGKSITVGDVSFYGYGGARTPFNTPFEPSDLEIENGLRAAYKKTGDAPVKVQVTHAPPVNTKLDVIFSGAHVGSEAVRKITEEFQPALAVSAHIHESKGVDVLGKTALVNPGRFPEGTCSLINIENGRAVAELVNLT